MKIETKERQEVEEIYKWDLSKMIKDEKDYKQKVLKLKKIVKQLEDFKGHIMESSDSLLNFYKLYDEYDRLISLIYVYSRQDYDVDTTNNHKQKLKTSAEKLYEDACDTLSFITPEMLKCPYSKVLEYVRENDELKNYSFALECLYRYQEHTLSETEEDIITKACNVFGSPEDAFNALDNTDIKLGNIEDENGNSVELTNSNYNKFLNCKDRNIRINAFNGLYNYWDNHKNTVAALLRGHIKEDLFLSKVRKYKSSLEASLYSDNISVKVYTNLINSVHDNLNIFYDYMNLRKKALNLDELHMYDMHVDIVENQNRDIPFNEGKKMIFEALKPLGDKYLKDLNKAFDERWIDIYPNVGKKSGAYSSGCYDSYPYLMLNYNNTIDSVTTLVHELGHSMHTYYSNSNQPSIYASYSIFLAEIASTVNEVLLNDYLYKHAKTRDEKILYLTEFLDRVRTTIYRQTMFAEFEMIMHDKEQRGVPLTLEEFSTTYYNLNKLYYGDAVVSDDAIKYEWMRIPHFYSSFYVYKYATGLSCALVIADGILNDKDNMRDKYLEFLKSGSSDYPLNILKKLGIDMTSKKVLNNSFNLFKEKLSELEKLY